MNKSTIMRITEKDLKHNPEMLLMTKTIIEYMFSLSPKEREEISFKSLSNACNLESKYETVAAIQYLSGQIINLFKIRFCFIEDEYRKELTLYDVFNINEHKEYLHPVTGIPVEDYSSKIFMYLSANTEKIEFN